MNICGHIISAKEIIGIGPVMMEKSGDHATRQMHNIRQLSFDLHLRNHTVKIDTGYLDLGYGDMPTAEEKDARERYLHFQEDHKSLMAFIMLKVEAQDLPEDAEPERLTTTKKRRTKTAMT